MTIEQESQEQHAKQPKLNSLLIEAVNNGFILYDNQLRSHTDAYVSERKVFNTKDQLKDYIDNNL